MKGNVTLPEDEIRFLEALPTPQMHARLAFLHAHGWSLSVLARSISPKRPKTTIHYWIRNASTLVEQRRPAPKPPPGSAVPSFTSNITDLKAVKVRFIAPKVPPELRPRLRELSDASRRYRARTPGNSSTAIANRELTRLAVELRESGIPTADIAKAAGVTYRAMSRRLKIARSGISDVS